MGNAAGRGLLARGEGCLGLLGFVFWDLQGLSGSDCAVSLLLEMLWTLRLCNPLIWGVEMVVVGVLSDAPPEL